MKITNKGKDDEAKRVEAATIIQKNFRGHRVQKALLSRELFARYNAIRESNMNNMPRAKGGKTRVYLPKDMPEIILKSSGREEAKKRFHQMQEVRAILDKQGSRHLVIPKARRCGEFIVEERLPISTDSFHNMALYLENPESFDEVVKEMTRLFSRVYLSDLVSFQHHPLSNIEGVKDTVRYDNLPLYMEGGKGMIGLIDLEHFEEGQHPKALQTLVRIFPLHLDVIKEEAKELGMRVNESSLDEAAKKGKKYLQMGFTDHLEWIKAKEAAIPSLHLSAERKEALAKVVEKELLELNEKGNPLIDKKRLIWDQETHFIKGNAKEDIEGLAACVTEKILSNLEKVIESRKEQFPSKKEAETVSVRSVVIKREELYEGVDEFILNDPQIQFKDEDAFHEMLIAEQLSIALLEELAKGGELFAYDPAYYSGGHEFCWIRF